MIFQEQNCIHGEMMSDGFELKKRPAMDNIFASALSQEPTVPTSLNIEVQFEGRTYKGVVYDASTLVDGEQDASQLLWYGGRYQIAGIINRWVENDIDYGYATIGGVTYKVFQNKVIKLSPWEIWRDKT